MEFSTDDIKHIAKLSRLEIANDEVEAYRGYFESIIGYVDKLAEVDTTNVPEMATGAISNNVWRVDEAQAVDPDERDAAINSFPRKSGALLEVPAVFESRTE
ncbi:MAG: Asp-tRNA(Asn)/Glu-tRNA(Gln) amidotransferase subunit GatC [Patescibacteria group bacterium]|jgi:aspartyl-tRNA(Asn)/glutamyl-tRNA(Gln) amidotransferase subunit C